MFRRALVEHDSTFSRHLATGSLPASRARRTVIRSLALPLPLPLTLTLTLASRARRTVTEARSSPRQRRRGWGLEAGGWRLEALSP